MIKIDQNKCTGCRICYNVCPQDVISIHAKKAKILNYTSCMECGACSLNCEFDAIELTKGTGCIAAIIKEDILKISQKGMGCGTKSSSIDGGCC